MKCECIHTCQFRGIVRRGEIRELTELELATPQLKASFRPLKTTDKPAEKKDAPLTGKDGKPIAQNGQMGEEQLKQKLTDMNVKFPPTANKQELFVLLQQTLEPNTKR